jgi:hypothetical protein
MNHKQITLTIAPSGELSIQAVGFHGPDCEQATAFLEQALGKITRRTRTRENHRRVHTQRKQQLGQ